MSGQRVEQGHVGDAQAAIVSCVLAQRQFAVQLLCRRVALGRRRLKAAVLVGHAIGALGEGLAVGGGLPLAQIALAVVLRALIVEAVGHFVADDHADAAKVDRRIDGEVEERRLQDAGRKIDVVERWVVVGVDGRRRHAPLLLVYRLAQMVEVPVALEDSATVQLPIRSSRFTFRAE